MPTKRGENKKRGRKRAQRRPKQNFPPFLLATWVDLDPEKVGLRARVPDCRPFGWPERIHKSKRIAVAPKHTMLSLSLSKVEERYYCLPYYLVTMNKVRRATHAGSWYERDPKKLDEQLSAWLKAVNVKKIPRPPLSVIEVDEPGWKDVSKDTLTLPIAGCKAIIAP